MKEFEEEIKRLKFELMVSIPEEIKTALESGFDDGSLELSDILTRQEFINIRLNQLLHRLESYKTINVKSIPKDKVSIGSLVKVKHLEKDVYINFLITYPEFMTDADSYIEVTVNSPIGKSLMNKSIGDSVVAHLPNETVMYNIIDIHPLYAFGKMLDF